MGTQRDRTCVGSAMEKDTTPEEVSIVRRLGGSPSVPEYVEGISLVALRAAMKRDGERLDDRATLFMAMRIFAELAAAHGARDARGAPAPLLHGALDPSKLMFTLEGEVEILGFPVPRADGARREARALLAPGSDGYLAPEQARGEQATERSDVFAATLIVWEELTGKTAFERAGRSDAELLRAMATTKIVPLEKLRPDLPRAVLAAVRLGLDPRHHWRRVTASKMVTALRGVVDSSVGRSLLVDALARHHDDGYRMVVRSSELIVVPEEPPPHLPASIAPMFASIAPPSESALPRARRRAGPIGPAVALVVAVGVAVTLLQPSGTSPSRTLAASATAVDLSTIIAPSPATAPPAASSGAAIPAASELVPAPSPSVGDVSLPPLAVGHRIFVDGRVVGEGAATLQLPCGAHAIRIGSAGTLQQVTVPCGGAITLTWK